jgi:CDP-paratose 2-epimerase
MLFLSTSRVYPMGPLGSLPLFETETRFEWDPVLNELDLYPGITTWGVSERFPLTGARSIYGATKLASELFIQEYTAAYGMPTLIDRCGVLAGPWQMGKVDQGVVMHWVASHFFARPLRYIGYGGSGKQVRDVLHIDDLVDLVELQLARFPSWHAEVFNVGGGRASSVSLLELTTLCRHETGVELDIPGVAETRQADIPLYLTDNSLVTETFDWSPRRKPETIVHDIYRWMVENRNQVQEALGI